jgi:hypothetical protein
MEDAHGLENQTLNQKQSIHLLNSQLTFLPSFLPFLPSLHTYIPFCDVVKLLLTLAN